MRRHATLIVDRKLTLEGGLILQAVVWELPVPLPGSCHRFKYRLYYGRAGECLIRFDNERGKGDHFHVGGDEQPYRFVNLATLLRDFYREIDRIGGNR